MRSKVLIPALILACATGVAAADRATAVGTDLRVDHAVDGDAVVIAGNLTLGGNARVSGDAIAVLGTVEVEPGAIVTGRTIAVRSLAGLELDPDVHRTPGATALGVALLSIGGWLVVASALAYLAPRMVARGMVGVSYLSWRLAVLGILSVATVIAALVAVLGLGPDLGVPLAALVIAFFLALKALGLTLLGGLGGRFMLDRAGLEDVPLTVQVLAGATPLLLFRFLPLIGEAAWSVVSVLALGGGLFAVITAWLARSADAEPGPVPH